MSSAVHIRPREDVVDSPLGSVPIAQVDLGGVPRGAVLVLLGTSQDFAADAAQQLNALAAHGYEGIAADLGAVNGSDEQLLGVATSLVDHLARRDWYGDQIGVVGYGLGGRIALLTAAGHRLGAAVGVSPTGLASDDGGLTDAVLSLAPAIRTPWLGLVGEEDASAPAAACERLAAVLDEEAPVYTQVVRYPGVGGDFYHPASESIEIAASYDYWQRTVEWLNLRVQPRLTPLAVAWHERLAAS